MLRVIVASSKCGDREQVCFTENLEDDAETFFYMDEMEIRIDEMINSLPTGFPLEHILIRE